MKLILQIALGVFLAELAMHEIINLERHDTAPHAAISAASVPAKPLPAPPTSAPPAAALTTDQACSHEEINGKTYNCCLESQRDPTVRSCTAVPTR